jgi:hypothetical protein
MRIDCNSAGVHREMIAGIAGNVNLGTRNASVLCIVVRQQQQWRNVGPTTMLLIVRGVAVGVFIGKAVSLVVSGGYEDDDDMGEQFKYSGSGGTPFLLLHQIECNTFEQ